MGSFFVCWYCRDNTNREWLTGCRVSCTIYQVTPTHPLFIEIAQLFTFPQNQPGCQNVHHYPLVLKGLELLDTASVSKFRQVLHSFVRMNGCQSDDLDEVTRPVVDKVKPKVWFKSSFRLTVPPYSFEHGRPAFGPSWTEFLYPECRHFDNDVTSTVNDVLTEHGGLLHVLPLAVAYFED